MPRFLCLIGNDGEPVPFRDKDDYIGIQASDLFDFERLEYERAQIRAQGEKEEKKDAEKRRRVRHQSVTPW